MRASEAVRATPVDGVAAVASDVRTPVWVCCCGRPVSNVRYRRVCVLRAWFGQWCHVYVCRAYTWLRVCCCWVRHARVVQCGCLLLGVCETFQRVSQRGYTSPFVLQGPNLGNLVACVLLMNNATMPSFIHSYITCQTSVTNIPARAAAGRRGQNVRYIPARSLATANVRSCPTTVETCSCRFILLSFHETRARESLSLSLSSHRLAKQNVAPSDGCFPSPALPPRRKGAGHAVRMALGRVDAQRCS